MATLLYCFSHQAVVRSWDMVLTRYMTRSAAMVHSAIPARSSILVRLLGVTRSAAMVHSSVMPRSGILVRSAYVNSILYLGALNVIASFRGHGALNCGDSLKPPGSFAVLRLIRRLWYSQWL